MNKYPDYDEQADRARKIPLSPPLMPHAGCSFAELVGWLEECRRLMDEELYAAGRKHRPMKRLKSGWWVEDESFAMGGYFVHDGWLKATQAA